MEPAIKRALDEAFRSDETTRTCLAVARLFSDDKTPRTLASIAEKINHGEGITLISLDRMVRETGIMDHYPEYSDTVPQIVYKFKMRDGYADYLKHYAVHPYL